MKNKILSVCIVALMFLVIGCNKTSSNDINNPINNIANTEKATNENNEKDKNDENGENDEKNENEIIEFTDFLVERCVRKQLNKNWDDEITMKDIKGITSLYITNMYDPTFATSRYSFEPVYRGYIDLSDLQYFKNLEELIIDAFINYDSIVNLDQITKCKKIKKICMPSCDYASDCSINPLGYKDWKDIVSELPELQYLDLERYFDEHMQEVVLSETNNKDIEFYFGPKDKSYDSELEVFYYQRFSASSIGINRATFDWTEKQNVSNYEMAWDYEYKTVMDKITSFSGMSYTGVFPAIYADDMDELKYELKNISKNIEDIIIVFNSQEEFDFSVFDSFSNLVTLSVIGTKFEQEKYIISEALIKGDYLGTTAININSLSNNKNLQVLNLRGFVGDISDIKRINNLRELSIIDCEVDSVEFIAEMESVRELILSVYTDGDTNNFYSNLDESVSNLINLKCYVDQNYNVQKTVELYENIDNMESLETLFVYDNKCLDNIVKSKTLKNLGVGGYQETDKVSFEKMDALEVLSIYFMQYPNNIDYNSIIELPNIKSIGYPPSVGEEGVLENVLTYDLALAVTNNEHISAFCPSYRSIDYESRYLWETDREFMRELYEAGIHDGIFQHWIKDCWRSGYEYTFENFCENRK